MDPVEVLIDEHGLIRWHLDLLAQAQSRIETGDGIPGPFFEKAARFAAEFSDAYHHFKEEHFLFLLLSQKTGSRLDGELAFLRHQWERCQSSMNGVVESAQGYLDGEPRSGTRLLECLASYGAVARKHIHTEEEIVFPIARLELTPKEADSVLEHFDAERHRLGSDPLARYKKLLTEMSLSVA